MKKLILFILTALLLVSCSEDTKTESGESRIFFNSANFTKNGELFFDNESRLNFIDFENLISTPLCPYPNCLHNNSNVCPSYNMSDRSFIAGDKLYYLQRAVSYDNKGMPVSNITVNSANLDGTDKRILNTLNDAEPYFYAMLLDEYTLYFLAASCERDEFAIPTGYVTLSLYSYDITDNSLKTIAIVDQGHIGGLFRGIYNSEAYLEYVCTDEQLDYLTIREEDMPDPKLCKINIITGEKTQITDYKPLYAILDLFVYFKDGKTYIEQPGKELLVFDDFCKEDSNNFFYVNGVLISKFEGAVDLNENKLYKISDKYKWYDIIGFKNGEYIVRLFDNDTQLYSYEKATKEMLFE